MKKKKKQTNKQTKYIIKHIFLSPLKWFINLFVHFSNFVNPEIHDLILDQDHFGNNLEEARMAKS